MNYIEASQRAYLKQQGLEYTEENVLDYGLSDDLKLLAETEKQFIVLHGNADTPKFCQFLNVVTKDGLNMETIEL